KPYAEGGGTLAMWVIGANSDGSVPTDMTQRERLLRHVRALTLMFGRPGTALFEQETPDGWLECEAEVVQSYDFTTMAGVTRAQFAVEYAIPKAFWQDAAVRDQTMTTSSPGIVLFSQFAGATAPLTDLVVELKGPATQPMMANPLTGQWVRLDRSLSSSQVWRLEGATSKVGSVNEI